MAQREVFLEESMAVAKVVEPVVAEWSSLNEKAEIEEEKCSIEFFTHQRWWRRRLRRTNFSDDQRSLRNRWWFQKLDRDVLLVDDRRDHLRFTNNFRIRIEEETDWLIGSRRRSSSSFGLFGWTWLEFERGADIISWIRLWWMIISEEERSRWCLLNIKSFRWGDRRWWSRWWILLLKDQWVRRDGLLISIVILIRQWRNASLSSMFINRWTQRQPMVRRRRMWHRTSVNDQQMKWFPHLYSHWLLFETTTTTPRMCHQTHHLPWMKFSSYFIRLVIEWEWEIDWKDRQFKDIRADNNHQLWFLFFSVCVCQLRMERWKRDDNLHQRFDSPLDMTGKWHCQTISSIEDGERDGEEKISFQIQMKDRHMLKRREELNLFISHSFVQLIILLCNYSSSNNANASFFLLRQETRPALSWE